MLFRTLWLILIFSTVLGYQNPVKKIKITSLFGESRGDHFHTGMDFALPQPIYPIEQGELLFYLDKNSHPESPHFGFGNVIVVEHFDRLRSYYLHLADHSIKKNRNQVLKKEPIAIMGDSGHSLGHHLHLTTVDFGEKKILNPHLILPQAENKVPPKITTFFTSIKGKIYKFNPNSFIRYFASFPLYVVAGDLKYDRSSSTPFNAITGLGLKSLTLEIDDQLVRHYDFRFIHPNENGELVIPSQFTHEDVYGLSYNYKFGFFSPSAKKHTFKITAEDWNKLHATKKFNIRFE